MKYLVEYFNIQGFLGYHSFTIEEGINSISSKYNGTGKSTLFDCLRLLAVRANHDNDALFYMINHDALEAFFRVTNKENEVYGFYLNKEKGSFLYTRHLPEDESIQYSEYVFPEMWEKLNLFVKNGNYVNIADRFIDLFSSSNISFNSSLVQELMLHEETEKVYEELLSRMDLTKNEMSQLYAEANTLMLQRDQLPHYPKLVDLYNLLYNEELLFNYEIVVAILGQVSSLQLMPTLIKLPQEVTGLYRLQEQLLELTPVRIPVNIITVQNCMVCLPLLREIELLFPAKAEVSSVQMEYLKYLFNLQETVKQLQKETPAVSVPQQVYPLFRLKESIHSLETSLKEVDYKEKRGRMMILFEMSSLLEAVVVDKEKERQHRQEFLAVQERLKGQSCPTCKQILKGGDSLCEHHS